MLKNELKPRFFSAYNRENSRKSCVGSSVAPVFADGFDDNGVAIVIVTGHTNLDDYIQSFKDDVDIYKILDRLSLSGSELPVVPSDQYFDVTEMPTNIHDAQRQMAKARIIFNNLPSDKRKEYNNSFDEFIADFGSSKFVSLFFDKKPASEVKPATDSKEVTKDVNAK